MKKFIVAAVMTLCAAGAYASNFRGGDQVYIPSAGHLQGGSNTFVSDVYLANLEPDTIVISVIYQPVNTKSNPSDPNTIGTEFKDVITLAPFERKEFKDFFPTVLGLQTGFGQLIFNGCLQGANCGAEGQDDEANSENYRSLSAESRIYSYPTASGPSVGTTGQLFSGIPWYNFISIQQQEAGLNRAFITGVTHGNGFRTNIGVINASQYASTSIKLTLYQGRLRDEDKKGEFVVDLTPLESVQKNIPSWFAGAPSGGNMFVVVEQIGASPNPNGVPQSCEMGCAAFLAYGSVLDGITGDATTLETQYLSELSDAAILVLYPSGAGKKDWRRAVRH